MSHEKAYNDAGGLLLTGRHTNYCFCKWPASNAEREKSLNKWKEQNARPEEHFPEMSPKV